MGNHFVQESHLIAQKHGATFIADLKPSKKLHRLVIVIHIIALAAGFGNALPLAVKLAIAVVIGLSFKVNFPKFNNEPRKIKYTEKLGWEIAEDDKSDAVNILSTTVVTTTFIFLHIQQKPSIIIANDALSEDDYRQLIIKLKMTVH